MSDERAQELVAARKQAEAVVEGMPEGPERVKLLELAFLDLSQPRSTKGLTKSTGQSRKRRAKSSAAATSSARRPKKREGAKAHGHALIAGGFFKEHRDVLSVGKELLKRGHKYRSEQVSTALIRLTRDGELHRQKEKPNGGKEQWVYFE